MDLPLNFELRLAAPDAAVRAALAALPLCNFSATDGALSFDCPRRAKMGVLAALAGRGDVLDLHMHEPSLEDVYLGYSG
jgi:Cu-processing system ATP-binding protein